MTLAAAPISAAPIAATSAAPGLSLTATHGSDRERLAAAAKQFEAIFVRQMLAAARKTSFGDSPFSDSQGLGTFREMQDDRFAQIAADSGAFGIAAAVEKQLSAQLGEGS